MIRLATVFSGIGAIEHALDRMQVEHKIVFACDNGDVEILTKNIGMNCDEIKNELDGLKKKIDSIHENDDIQDLYKSQLFGMLQEATVEYKAIVSIVKKYENLPNGLIDILNAIVVGKTIKNSKLKYCSQLRNELRCGSPEQRCFKGIQTILEITNDFKKDNPLDVLGKHKEFNSSDGINWRLISPELKKLYDYVEIYNGKKVIRKVQDLSQRISQLHEKINYIAIQKTLESMGSNWTSRKAYVDSLYDGQEKRNKVKQSYMANYDVPEKDFHWNVAFLNGRQYRGQVDLFVGGSPCQSFSFAGKQRGLNDTRGTLFYEYARLIKEIQPKVFIYENVKALITNDNGKTWTKMQQVFKELGYDFSWAVLNAKNYGIPQNRERVFVVGFRHDLKVKNSFEFPSPIPLKKVMKDFLVDHAPDGYFLPQKTVEFFPIEQNLPKKSSHIINGDKNITTDNVSDLEKYFLSEKMEKYVLSTGTKNFYSKPEINLNIARPLLTTMHKMHRAGVDNYVTTKGRLRKLTPRECLRLMGFSDNFKIVVSDTAIYQQAGNSIVVDVLIAIMTKILEMVDLKEI